MIPTLVRDLAVLVVSLAGVVLVGGFVVFGTLHLLHLLVRALLPRRRH